MELLPLILQRTMSNLSSFLGCHAPLQMRLRSPSPHVRQRGCGDLFSSDNAQQTFQFPHPNHDRAHLRLRAQVRCLHMQAKASPAHGRPQTFLMEHSGQESNRLHPKRTQCNSRATCLVALRYPKSTSKPIECLQQAAEFAMGFEQQVRLPLQEAVHKLVREVALPIDSPDAPR